MIKQLFAAAAVAVFMSACSMADKIPTGTDDTITDPTDSTKDSTADLGVVIVSERTEIIHFDSTSGPVTKIVGKATVNFDDIRNEIAKENMSLDLFAVTNLKIEGLPEFATFGTDNANLQMVLTVASALPGDTAVKAVETPTEGAFYPVETVGALQTGLELNNGLFAAKGGIESFESKLKDLANDKIEFTVEITFAQPVVVPDDFSLQFTVEGSSKKAI